MTSTNNMRKKFQGVVSLYNGKAYNALPGAHPS